MDDLHLADFVELQLKSKHDFNAAYDVALSAGLRDYMRKFVAIHPGDWPCQFYCRQSSVWVSKEIYKSQSRTGQYPYSFRHGSFT